MRNILLLFSLAMIIACRGNVGGHHHDEDEEHAHSHGSAGEIVIEPETAEKLGIKTIIAEKSEFSGIIKTGGKIEAEPTSIRSIIASCSGKVTFLKGELTCGSEVGKSEILFAVTSQGMNTQNNVAELEKCKLVMERAQKEYERAKKLKEERLVTESEFLQAKQDFQTAETDYRRMISSVDKRLTSPMKGFITSIYVKNGEYVEEGTTIATVSTGMDIVVEALLPARYCSKIGSIIGANFTSGLNGKIYSTDSRITSSDIAPNNGTTIPIRFKAKKEEGITVGIPVEVYLKISESKSVITLPKSAISERFGKYFVYEKLDEDCYAEREVAIGDSDGFNVEIKSGINERDEIVTEGVYYVKAAGNSTSIPHGHSH